MGAVSKKRPKPLKYKIIHDLSWRGANQRRFRSQYDTLDRAISLVQKSDTEAQMAKLDLSYALPAHRCAVKRPGTFGFYSSNVRGWQSTHWLIYRLMPARCPSYPLHLTRKCKQEPNWCITFLPQWNGKSFLVEDQCPFNESLYLFTDDSKLFFGAYLIGFGFVDFLIYRRINTLTNGLQGTIWHMIAAALTTLGPRLRGKRLIFRCNNKTVVKIIQKGSAPNCCPLRALLFVYDNKIDLSALYGHWILLLMFCLAFSLTISAC